MLNFTINLILVWIFIKMKKNWIPRCLENQPFVVITCRYLRTCLLVSMFHDWYISQFLVPELWRWEVCLNLRDLVSIYSFHLGLSHHVTHPIHHLINDSSNMSHCVGPTLTDESPNLFNCVLVSNNIRFRFWINHNSWFIFPFNSVISQSNLI